MHIIFDEPDECIYLICSLSQRHYFTITVVAKYQFFTYDI